jgi:hypothetical protein
VNTNLNNCPPIRKRLPDRRNSVLSNSKAGSDSDSAAKDSAVVCSLALQHGVPVNVIRKALLRDSHGRASSPLGVALDLLAGGQAMTNMNSPSGVDAARDIETKLRRYAPGAEIHFERPAVTRAQVDEWNLPTRPTKQTDTRAKKFGNSTSVELDAIPAEKLRALVRECIERHVDQRQLSILRTAEESERELLKAWADDHHAQQRHNAARLCVRRPRVPRLHPRARQARLRSPRSQRAQCRHFPNAARGRERHLG